jgi:hypothetical protein
VRWEDCNNSTAYVTCAHCGRQNLKFGFGADKDWGRLPTKPSESGPVDRTLAAGNGDGDGESEQAGAIEVVSPSRPWRHAAVVNTLGGRQEDGLRHETSRITGTVERSEPRPVEAPWSRWLALGQSARGRLREGRPPVLLVSLRSCGPGSGSAALYMAY